MGNSKVAGSTLGAQTRDESLLPVGHVVGGRYRIESMLGRGGMGEVFVATHINTGLIVALKVLLPELGKRSEFLRRFHSEARAVAALRHPGIVRVTDFDRDGDIYFMVMEKLEGEPLTERIRREAPLPVDFVLRLGMDICEAMSVAHRHRPKIVHRDLKPDNIFLTQEGSRLDVVKILDFGIAKLIDADPAAAPSMTSTGSLAGTPFYMSPEQMVNAKDVDERADIYAIGVLLYQALTGSVPYAADSLAELVLKIHGGPPPSLRELRPDAPGPLVDIIEKSMARERDNRVQTADELRNVLAACLEGREIPAPESADPLDFTPAPSRARWYVLGGMLVVAAVAAVLWFARSAPTPVAPSAVDSPSVAVPAAARVPAAAPVASPPATLAPAAAQPVAAPVPAPADKKIETSRRRHPAHSRPAAAPERHIDEGPKFRE